MDWCQEEGKGMEEEDETKGRLLWLMCDKCSQLGEFSRSLEQVIMQELLLARPRPALYWFTEMHATDGVCFPLNRLANPPKHSHLHPLLNVSYDPLALSSRFSTVTLVCGWKKVVNIQSNQMCPKDRILRMG